ncbi:MAG: hypothetical protein NVSMB45_10680 [Ginsengibacter sp.]
MNLQFQHHLPEHFNDDSRVWIYQSNRSFTIEEAIRIEELLEDFTSRWQSHGDKVTGFGNLFFGQFIILMADETASGVSGCSTDSSVRLIKNIEKDFQVNMFDRQILAFVLNERIQLMPLHELKSAFESNFLSKHTLYFDNTVLTKKDLSERWIVPVKDSWLSKKHEFAA